VSIEREAGATVLRLFSPVLEDAGWLLRLDHSLEGPPLITLQRVRRERGAGTAWMPLTGPLVIPASRAAEWAASLSALLATARDDLALVGEIRRA
jgi:hypothetical protein